ncbi:MAG: methionyl-tRNA formyltransferase [Betaproteobacteria bacterium]|nr:Methionyl-tRNA formyltransferase [Rhodocyclaceae bacterium]
MEPHPPLRVGFAGTPEFAARVLTAMLEAGYSIPLVLTQPDRPAGRGHALVASPVKRLAVAHGLPVQQPASLKTQAAQEAIAAARLDVLVVVAYGLLLPAAVLALPRLGCLNIHASLLPRWRGAAPIQRALLAGDAETGVCIMQMDAGLDTGPVLHVERVAIANDDTAASLHDRLAGRGAAALLHVLDGLVAGTLAAKPQSSEGVTYAAKLDKAEAAIDFRLPAPAIERALRAFDPFPGAYARIQDTVLKLWRATVTAQRTEAAPGTVLSAGADGVHVSCGEGTVLAVTMLQRPGGRRLEAAEFLRGFPIIPGSRFTQA